MEEEWGDWLMSQHQVDAAINHFIEAGCTIKAVEAALAARQWLKAAAVLDSQVRTASTNLFVRCFRPFSAASSQIYASVQGGAMQVHFAVVLDSQVRLQNPSPVPRCFSLYTSLLNPQT